MKIYTYKTDTKEFHDVVNAKYQNYTKKDEAINQYILDNGDEVDVIEFAKHAYRYMPSWSGDRGLEFFGQPKTVIEKLVYFIYRETAYPSLYRDFPEDFCEGRTDFSDMQGYCEQMSSFLEEILEDAVAEAEDK